MSFERANPSVPYDGEATLPITAGNQQTVAASILGDISRTFHHSPGEGHNINVASGDSRQIAGNVTTTFEGKIDSVTQHQTYNYYSFPPEGSSRFQKYRRIQEWLSPPAQRRVQINELEKRLQGTGLWFLESKTFDDWIHTPASLLWIPGGVGSGKTVLCAAMVKRVQQLALSSAADLAGSYVCYFYFSFQDPARQMLVSLLKETLSQLNSAMKIPPPLEALYDRCQQVYPPEEPSKSALQETLIETLLDLQPVQTLDQNGDVETGDSSQPLLAELFLFVDGLDEIAVIHRESITSFLQILARDRIPNLHILCTSRDYPDISQALSFPVAWPKKLMDTRAIASDIEHYVLEILSTSPSLQWLGKPSKTLVIEEVAKKSQGMFRLATLQMDMLKQLQLKSLLHLQKALTKLPTSLNASYERILAEVNDEARPMALTALQWIVTSKRPLFLEEIVEASKIPRSIPCGMGPLHQTHTPTPFDLVQMLRGLMSIQPLVQDFGSIPLKHHTVSIAHFSVEEFLTGRDISSSSVRYFGFTFQLANDNVARGCIAYIFSNNRRFRRPSYDKYPLLQYAWFHWEMHFAEDEDSRSSEPRAVAVHLYRCIPRSSIKSAMIEIWSQLRGGLPTCETRFRDAIRWIGSNSLQTLLNAINIPFFCDPQAIHMRPYTKQEIFDRSLPSSEIRLINVLPRLDPLEPSGWHYFTCPLSEAPPYVAISYRWGSGPSYTGPVAPGPLMAFPFTMPLGLKPVLSSILPLLFHVAEGPLAFWIDALTICQDDYLEKSSQVRMMPEIFKLAKEVVIFARESRLADQQAIQDIISLASICSQSDEEVKGAHFLLSLFKSRRLASLLGLFEGAWWRRCWTLQDIICSHAPNLFYSSLSMSFAIVELVFNSLDSLYSGLDNIPDGHIVKRNLESHHGWQRAQSICRTRKDFHSGYLTPLSELIHRFRHQICIHPSDKIYSLHEMTSDKFLLGVGDGYSIPCTEFYIRIALTLLSASKNLDLLAYCSTYRKDGYESDLDWPSWLPYFRGQVSGVIPLAATQFTGHSGPQFRVLGTLTAPNALVQRHSTSIGLTGIRLGYVQPSVSPLEDENCPIARLSAALGLADSKQTGNGIKWPWSRDLAEILSLHDLSGAWSPQDLLDSFSSPHYVVPPGQTVIECLWRTVLADQWPEGTRLTSAMYRGCAVPPRTEAEQGSLLHLPDIYDKLIVFARGRRLFKVACDQTGPYLGLGPRSMENGDVLVGFCKGSLPFILRESGNGNWRLIGECYVHGIMDGEAVDHQEQGDLVKEYFIIV